MSLHARLQHPGGGAGHLYACPQGDQGVVDVPQPVQLPTVAPLPADEGGVVAGKEPHEDGGKPRKVPPPLLERASLVGGSMSSFG